MTYSSAEPFKDLFYFAGSSRDPLLPPLFWKTNDQVPLTPSLPPHFRHSTIPIISLRHLSLYSLEEQQTLVVNLVKEKDEIDRLERLVYPGCVIRFDSTDGRLSYTQQFLPRVNEQNEEAEGVSPAGRDIKVALMSMESLDPEPSVPLKAILKKKTNTRNHFKKEKNEECIAKTKEVFEEYGIGRDSVDHTVNVFRHLVEEELYALLASDLSTDNPLATLSSSVSSTGSDDDAWSEEL